jgi:hypothetical protein
VLARTLAKTGDASASTKATRCFQTYCCCRLPSPFYIVLLGGKPLLFALLPSMRTKPSRIYQVSCYTASPYQGFWPCFLIPSFWGTKSVSSRSAPPTVRTDKFWKTANLIRNYVSQAYTTPKMTLPSSQRRKSDAYLSSMYQQKSARLKVRRNQSIGS